MNGKFFLFKRNNPNVDSALFSDNGKGLSILAVPASSVSYMAAKEGLVEIFFNNTSVFEENNLREGESFEKTNVSVQCIPGKEADFMESIINFINREKTDGVMRFDSTGERNTFKSVEEKPSIDAFVRKRPVKRGFEGVAATVKTNSLTLIDGLDFLSVSNLPVIDFSHTSLTGGSRSDITAMSNHIRATGGKAKNASLAADNDKAPPIVFPPDSACSTKSIDLSSGKFNEQEDIVSYVAGTFKTGTLSSGTSDAATMRLIRQGVFYSAADTLELVQLPTFEGIEINSSGVVTEIIVLAEGAGFRKNDILSFEATGEAVRGFILCTDPIEASQTGVNRAIKLEFEDVTIDNDYTIYATVVIPPNALTHPIYDGDATSNTEAKGLFPRDSLGDEFEVSHRNSSTFPSTRFEAFESTFPFSSEVFPASTISLSDALTAGLTATDIREPVLSSEKHLHSFVIRRTKDKDIIVYDRRGEIIARKPSGFDTDGALDIDNFGMVIGQPGGATEMRIARFGVVGKDMGDSLCRDIATQMFETYRV
jgi:hypothetical protein